MRGNRFVEPLDMSNFPECTLQVLEMQDGDGITNVYWGICDARIVAGVGAALSETEFGGHVRP
jgi:hypothetical protein